MFSPVLTCTPSVMIRKRSKNAPRALASTQAGQLTTALLVLASCLLPLGLLLPAMKTTQFAFWSEQTSILGFGIGLLGAEEFLLAIVVLGFSVAFPTLKLFWMWRLQFSRSDMLSTAQVKWLEMLGKWSMADVLIVALAVFSYRGNPVFSASPLPGIYVFSIAIILAMLASGRIIRQLHNNQGATPGSVNHPA